MENSDITLTVYGKPSCVQCTATERTLINKNREFTKIDVSQDEAAYQKIVEMGYQQVPVVIASNGDSWSGFIPDRLAVYC